MKVWKKQSVVWMIGSKRASKEACGASPRTLYSSKWYGTLTTFEGKKRQTPLTTDRDTSLTLLKTLQRTEDERRARGFTRAEEQREKPIAEHLLAFEAYLRSKNNTDDHISKTINRIRKLLQEAKVASIADLDATQIQNILAVWRRRKVAPLGIASTNHYLTAAKGFSRFLWTDRRTPEDLLRSIRKLNAQTDRRRIRRALAADEVSKITTSTGVSGKTYRGENWSLSPENRVLLYSIALYTGLRSIEIASLRHDSFNLESRTLTVEASNTKNRKKAILPVHPDLCRLLFPVVKQGSNALIFPGPLVAQRLAGKVFQRDLKRAGIAARDDQGRVLDFHSLRYTFITNLAKAGVHPGKAQRLARHSDINLTMTVYTQLEIEDLREAVESL